MSCKQSRLVNIFMILLLLMTGHRQLAWYPLFMQASLEVLNRQATYCRHQCKLYNMLFTGCSFLLLRRVTGWNETIISEYTLNTCEHLFFAVVICIKIYVYIKTISGIPGSARWQPGLIAFFTFTGIGVINEIFQNQLCQRSLFLLIPDSVKDIMVNTIGASIFMAAVLSKIMFTKLPRNLQRAKQ